jgi:hypothetical protein
LYYFLPTWGQKGEGHPQHSNLKEGAHHTWAERTQYTGELRHNIWETEAQHTGELGHSIQGNWGTAYRDGGTS